jgi:Putative porin
MSWWKRTTSRIRVATLCVCMLCAVPVLAQSRSAEPSSPASASQAESRLVVSGDFRLRGQGDYSDSGSRNSAQVRGRLGATYKVNERLKVGARMATGDADDPNSTDVQLSNFDDDLQVSLDLAYVQLDLGEVKVYGGKIPQPFARTELVWDGDVNPQGASVTYEHTRADGSTLRANSLFFLIDEQAVGPESTLFGAQLSYGSHALQHWKYEISAAYYDSSLRSVAGRDSGDFRTNLLNPDGSYRSDFDLADVILAASWSGLGERWPVRIVGDYVRNLGAATEADSGYGIDCNVGRVSRGHDWRVSYGYSAAETDAVLAAFSHDNIGVATNYRLHTFALDYVPTPKTLVTATWYHYRPYREISGTEPAGWLDRVRIAFMITF